MKSLEVTDEQYAFVQHLREEISEQVVGKYGHVREKDAVQFLIDNLDGDLEVDGEFDAGDVSVDSLEDGDGPDDLEEVSYDEADDGAADGQGPEESSDATGGEADEEGAESDPETGDDTESTDGSDDDGAADDDDMLDEMMSLLETHDDKWEESSSGDHRYSVELPDGSTEEVQTKDDVRAILFKNYR
ncbi:hypothetical protein HALLA_11360 [Halostagnicola larsenii XH-48]|uniref:Uncharacterized protein n=1 Tax=Halostagnicola larsenii XH-48 TaxID=797299 RepID=W0JQX7_9EURY|nr:hypothetical protein [Halostagnicola larsenii]AHF99372.1 hypothetical protein HALLA_11360 [Halostagnicola larsenii XH-48]